MEQHTFFDAFTVAFLDRFPNAKPTIEDHQFIVAFESDMSFSLDLKKIYDPSLSSAQMHRKIQFAIEDISKLYASHFENNKPYIDLDQIIIIIRSPNGTKQLALHDPILEHSPLSIFYALDHDDSIFYLSQGFLDHYGLSIDRIRQFVATNTLQMTIIDASKQEKLQLDQSFYDVEFYDSVKMYNAQFLRKDFFDQKPSEHAIICFLDVYTTIVLYLPNHEDISLNVALKDDIYNFFYDAYQAFTSDADLFPFALFYRNQKTWKLFK